MQLATSFENDSNKFENSWKLDSNMEATTDDFENIGSQSKVAMGLTRRMSHANDALMAEIADLSNEMPNLNFLASVNKAGAPIYSVSDEMDNIDTYNNKSNENDFESFLEEMDRLKIENNQIVNGMKKMQTCHNKLKQELNQKNVQIAKLERIVAKMKDEAKNEAMKQDNKDARLKSNVIDSENITVDDYLQHFRSKLDAMENKLSKSIVNVAFLVSISIECKQLLNRIENETNKIQVCTEFFV